MARNTPTQRLIDQKAWIDVSRSKLNKLKNSQYKVVQKFVDKKWNLKSWFDGFKNMSSKEAAQVIRYQKTVKDISKAREFLKTQSADWKINAQHFVWKNGNPTELWKMVNSNPKLWDMFNNILKHPSHAEKYIKWFTDTKVLAEMQKMFGNNSVMQLGWWRHLVFNNKWQLVVKNYFEPFLKGKWLFRKGKLVNSKRENLPKKFNKWDMVINKNGIIWRVQKIKGWEVAIEYARWNIMTSNIGNVRFLETFAKSKSFKFLEISPKAAWLPAWFVADNVQNNTATNPSEAPDLTSLEVEDLSIDPRMSKLLELAGQDNRQSIKEHVRGNKNYFKNEILKSNLDWSFTVDFAVLKSFDDYLQDSNIDESTQKQNILVTSIWLWDILEEWTNFSVNEKSWIIQNNIAISQGTYVPIWQWDQVSLW